MIKLRPFWKQRRVVRPLWNSSPLWWEAVALRWQLELICRESKVRATALEEFVTGLANKGLIR